MGRLEWPVDEPAREITGRESAWRQPVTEWCLLSTASELGVGPRFRPAGLRMARRWQPRGGGDDPQNLESARDFDQPGSIGRAVGTTCTQVSTLKRRNLGRPCGFSSWVRGRHSPRIGATVLTGPGDPDRPAPVGSLDPWPSRLSGGGALSERRLSWAAIPQCARCSRQLENANACTRTRPRAHAP